jgi:hypothetical protein
MIQTVVPTQYAYNVYVLYNLTIHVSKTYDIHVEQPGHHYPTGAIVVMIVL